MKPYVHKSATVHPTAVLREGCWIGPNVEICEGAVIGQYSVIGGSPEHASFYDDVAIERSKGVAVGVGARVFEFVTIQAGTRRKTLIGREAAVFQHSHVSHDCAVENYATICGRASLAGFVVLGERAIVGAHAIVHQHVVIGAFAMVGMASALKTHVPVGETWLGFPARQVGLNDVGLERAGLSRASALAKYDPRYTEWKGQSLL
jgi:UDP-N-acetylglucosamine acyltransferase